MFIRHQSISNMSSVFSETSQIHGMSRSHPEPGPARGYLLNVKKLESSGLLFSPLLLLLSGVCWVTCPEITNCDMAPN